MKKAFYVEKLNKDINECSRCFFLSLTKKNHKISCQGGNKENKYDTNSQKGA